MTARPLPRRAGAVLLAAAAAAGFWAGWALGLVPLARPGAALGAGLLAAPLLLWIDRDRASLQGLAATLLGLCPTVALLLVLAGATELDSVAAGLGLWPLVLSLFASWLALTLMPGAGSRAAFARAGFGLALVLTLGQTLGLQPFFDRWVLQSPVHMLIAFTACLVFAGQARVAIAGRAERGEARLTTGMTQLLPLLGFAGTVWGIMVALAALPAIFASATPSPEALQTLLGGLGTAFETTLLGLSAAVLASIIDMLLPEEASQ